MHYRAAPKKGLIKNLNDDEYPKVSGRPKPGDDPKLFDKQFDYMKTICDMTSEWEKHSKSKYEKSYIPYEMLMHPDAVEHRIIVPQEDKQSWGAYAKLWDLNVDKAKKDEKNKAAHIAWDKYYEELYTYTRSTETDGKEYKGQPPKKPEYKEPSMLRVVECLPYVPT